MQKELAQRLLRTMFKFRKVELRLPPSSDLNLGELTVLKQFAQTADGLENHGFIAEMQSHLNITKPAISQIVSGLEKKGYIHREIDQTDRRRFVITVTPKGHTAMECMKAYADHFTSEIITRFGEANTEQLLALFDGFCAVVEDVKREAPWGKGEDHHA